MLPYMYLLRATTALPLEEIVLTVAAPMVQSSRPTLLMSLKRT